MIIMRKQLAAFILALVAIAVVFFGIKKYESRQTFADRDFKIVLDAGHGEPDGGAVGVNGTLEKDVNIAIVEKIREVLESRGTEVIMTREGDSGLQDESAKTIRQMKVSDMNRRLDIIKESDADLFISIHMNSFSDSSVNGLHVFYDKSHPDAEGIAAAVQDKISEVTGAKVHAVKTADEKLFLMKNPPIPSILVECGFLSNPEEENKLNNEDYQARIAWAIASALENYTK
ncbi:MAG: N-acetylmuramoyl-L-alanine amidase [Oscillospiraceae bacterium]|nr:N-acetylmuramoyl-L-alanine amidase [Oscillospiraceae bacterium]